MSDRIDELVGYISQRMVQARDYGDTTFAKTVREGDRAALTDLATIAREAEANAKGQEANAVFALQLKRDAEAEADRWRKVAEWLAEEATSSDFRYTWTTTDERIAAALAAVEQEEAE